MTEVLFWLLDGKVVKRLSNLFSRQTLGMLWDTACRFPVPVLCATACTFWMTLDIYEVGLPLWSLVHICGLGVLTSAAVVVFVESRNWPRLVGIVAGALIVGLIALNLIDAGGDGGLEARVYEFLAFFWVGAILLGMVAPFTRRDCSDDAAWVFGYRLWRAAGLGLAIGLIFSLGVTALFITLGAFFSVNLPFIAYPLIWIFGLVLFWPLVALMLVPQTFSDEFPNGSPAWLRPIAVWLLVPLAISYLALMNLYAIAALFGWKLLTVPAVFLVSGLVGFSVVTFLVSHPWRNAGIWWLNLFWRVQFPALIAPTLLLIVEAEKSVAMNGISGPNYLLMVVLVWLLISIPVFTFGLKRLVLLPGLLGAMLVLSSFGPWGVGAVSTRSQIGHLEGLLTEYGYFSEGRFIAAGTEVPPSAGRKIDDTLEYLRMTGKLVAIAPWFPDIKEDPPSADLRDEMIFDLISRISKDTSFHISTSFDWNSRVGLRGLPVTGFDWVSFYDFEGEEGFNRQGLVSRYKSDDVLPYTVTPDPNSYELTLTMEDGREIVFDLEPMLEAALEAGYDGETESDEHLDAIMSSEIHAGTLRGRLAVQSISGRKAGFGHSNLKEGELSVGGVEVVIMVAEQEP